MQGAALHKSRRGGVGLKHTRGRAHQIARQRRQPTEIVVRKAKLDCSTERPFFFSSINFLEPLHALIEFAGARLEIVGASTGDHVAVGVGVPRGAAAN